MTLHIMKCSYAPWVYDLYRESMLSTEKMFMIWSYLINNQTGLATEYAKELLNEI